MRDHPQAGRRPARAAVALATGATLAALMASGCTTIPTGGTPQGTQAPPALDGGGAGCCQLLVGPPQPGWTPEQVVKGFLYASASFANDHAIAREYLTPEEKKAWDPGSQVTILAGPPSVSKETGRQFASAGRISVLVTGQQLASLNASGQYVPAAPGAAANQTFILQSVGGEFLIDRLPTTELMLSSDLFHLEYAPHNLYYYGPSEEFLVPDPVFVPTASQNPATTLVNDLLNDPKGWLQNAAKTAFPAAAQLRKIQVLPGKTAIVDIRLPPGTPGKDVKKMAAQLVTTLTSQSYGPALFQTVKLKINGRSPPSIPPVQDSQSYAQDVPHWRSNAAVYYLTRAGSVRMLGRLALHGVKVGGQAGTGQVPLTQVAISPDGKYLAGIAGPATTVYTESLAAGQRPGGGQLRARLTGAEFTSLSWDSSGDLWVTGRRHHTAGVWVLRPTHWAPVRVHLPTGLSPVTGLRVAPDGVRIAMITGTGKAARLLLTAVVHVGGKITIIHTVPRTVVQHGGTLSVAGMLPLAPGPGAPTSLTWYDEDNLLVVTQTSSGARLLEVPVNGNSGVSLGGQAGIESITAAGRENPLYLSLSSGQVEKAVGLGALWTDITIGQAATYPG